MSLVAPLTDPRMVPAALAAPANRELAAAVAAARESANLPAGARIVAAMSGGVDSSVAAGLLARAGFEVVGITLRLYDSGTSAGRLGSCCAGQDIDDARAAAATLGLPHYVLDYERRFRESVVEPFADAYVRGETPTPCIRCNQTVKFRDLMEVAGDLGAEAMATGHYVRRTLGADGAPQLRRAVDEARDQSWFLFATTARQLAFLRFPLGGLAKPAVRRLAAALGLSVANKPDSQDICFVPQGRYTTVIERLRPDARAPGDIVHLDGRVLGRHGGIAGYTVGQRRGLNVALGEPLFVVRLDPGRRHVVVGPRAALLARGLRLEAVNWLGDEPSLAAAATSGRRVFARIRSTRPPAPARLATGAAGEIEVRFDEPQEAISPGQACVLYDADDPDRVLGGGLIGRGRESVGEVPSRRDRMILPDGPGEPICP